MGSLLASPECLQVGHQLLGVCQRKRYIRREVLDHVIVLNERHLRESLRSYFRYYHASRTHLALDKDAPEPRAVEPPDHGRIVALPLLGGLHHRYVRRAA